MYRIITAVALLLCAQTAVAFGEPPPAGPPVGPPAAPPVMATIPPAAQPGQPAPACSGPDPAIVSVAVTNTTPQGNLNQYTMTGTVTNLGSMGQAKNVIQSVDIFMRNSKTGQKLDQKGIPPLNAGQSYTFTYTSMRSNQAGNGTSQLLFKLDISQPSPPGSQDCNTVNDTFLLRF